MQCGNEKKKMPNIRCRPLPKDRLTLEDRLSSLPDSAMVTIHMPKSSFHNLHLTAGQLKEYLKSLTNEP